MIKFVENATDVNSIETEPMNVDLNKKAANVDSNKKRSQSRLK